MTQTVSLNIIRSHKMNQAFNGIKLIYLPFLRHKFGCELRFTDCHSAKFAHICPEFDGLWFNATAGEKESGNKKEKVFQHERD